MCSVSDRRRWQLVRRFFLVDNVSGKTNLRMLHYVSLSISLCVSVCLSVSLSISCNKWRIKHKHLNVISVTLRWELITQVRVNHTQVRVNHSQVRVNHSGELITLRWELITLRWEPITVRCEWITARWQLITLTACCIVNSISFITSDKGGGKCFCPRLFVCLFVCQSVCKITQKCVRGFGWNVACRQTSGHGWID